MTSPDVSRRVLDRILAWGSGIPEFKQGSVRLGIFAAQVYLGDEAEDEEQLFSLALTFVWWIWIDDWSDQHLGESHIDWGRLLGELEHQAQATSASSPELNFLLRLSALLKQKARSRVDYDYWLASAISVLDAARREEEVSRTRERLGYAEYLEVGCRSIAVMNVMATASLLSGLGVASRRFEPLVAEGIRYVCTIGRLENDLHSYQRDCQEGGLANAVLVLESFLPIQQAKDFVDAEKKAYERLLSRVLDELGPRDPFTGLARRALSCQTQCYQFFQQERYHPA